MPLTALGPSHRSVSQAGDTGRSRLSAPVPYLQGQCTPSHLPLDQVRCSGQQQGDYRAVTPTSHTQGEVMGTMVSSSCTSQGHLCATEPQGALGPPKHQVKAAMSSHDHHCFILPRFEPARDIESFSFLFRTATELQKAAPSLPGVRSSAETPHLL